MSHSILLYGATGFTGRLLGEAAKARGLPLILAARNARKLGVASAELGMTARVASLDETSLRGALDGVGVVLNAAGPFSITTDPLIRACLRAGVHYLDVSAESTSIERARGYDGAARERGVMVMPAVGFDVVPSDCLAAHVARRAVAGRRLRIGISGLQLMSRGSARTIFEEFGRPISIRRGGALVDVAPGSLERSFDYGQGPRASAAVSWGDVATAYYTTGIPNVEVYFEATGPVRAALLARRMWGPAFERPLVKAWWQGHTDLLPPGPTLQERERRTAVIVAEVEDEQGRRFRSRLRSPEGYTMTALTAPAIAQRVAEGDFEAGFQTPARVYGADLALSFPGVSREDLD